MDYPSTEAPPMYITIREHMYFIRDFLGDAIDNLSAFLDELSDHMKEVTPDYGSVPDITVPEMEGMGEVATPTEPDISYEGPGDPPDLPSFSYFVGDPGLDLNIPDISMEDVPSPPDFTIQPPTIDMPEDPQGFTGDIPDTPRIEQVTMDEISVPDIPSIPNFGGISLPPAISFTVPSLSEIDTSWLDNQQPPDEVQWEEAEYNAKYLGLLLDRMWSNIVEGGTGISTEAEEAIWERGHEREDAAYQRAVSKITDSWSARGMSLPNGLLADMINEITFERYTKEVDRSRDIMAKQAELEQENMKFSATSIIQIEQAYLQHHEAAMDRALRAAIAASEVGSTVYRAKIEAFNSKLRAIQISAEVFRARLQAESTKAEFYRAMLEGTRTNVELQRLFLDRYRMQLQGIEILTNVDRLRMERSRTMAELERLKLELYRGQIEAYNSQVRAKVAEFDLYRAKLEGQGMKVRLYGEQASAYQSRIGAYRGRVDAEVAKLQAQYQAIDAKLRKEDAKLRKWAEKVRALDSHAKTKIAGYDSQVRGYTAKQEAISAWRRSVADVYNSKVRAYAATVEAEVNKVRASVEEARVALDASKAKASNYLEKMRQQLEVFTRLAALDADNIKTAGQFYASLASSAMQAMHAGMNLSYATSDATSKSDIYEHAVT